MEMGTSGGLLGVEELLQFLEVRIGQGKDERGYTALLCGTGKSAGGLGSGLV